MKFSLLSQSGSGPQVKYTVHCKYFYGILFVHDGAIGGCCLWGCHGHLASEVHVM